eukprot:g14724.t1
MNALHNVPLKWRLLIGGQVLVTAGLMVHRMETISSMNEERRVQRGEGRFAPPPAADKPRSERPKGSTSGTGGH